MHIIFSIRLDTVRLPQSPVESSRQESRGTEAGGTFAMKLTYERLLAFLIYDPNTGVFRNRKNGNIIAANVGRTGHVIKIDRVNYIKHRLAWFYMTGEYPKQAINHKDGDFANNKFSNLRQLTETEKRFNCKISSVNTSGYKGVSWDREKQKWRAQARINGRHFSLGRYDTPEEAAKVYNEFARSQHGEFYKNTLAKAPEESQP
jgi:hypothetical protein